MLRNLPPSTLLRHVLAADAVASGGMSVLLVLGSSLLGPLLGLSANLLLWAGIILVPFAILVGFVATRSPPPIAAVGAIATVNLAWVAASGLLVLPPATPTPVAYALVLVQALAVLTLAALQIAANRPRPRGAAGA